MALDHIVKNFLNLTPDAVVIGRWHAATGALTVARVNAGFTRLFGHAREHVTGESAFLVAAPEALANLEDEVARRLSDGARDFRVETRCLRTDASRFWASIAFAMVEADDDGSFVVATFHDVTDLRSREIRAAQALQERNHAHRELESTQTRLVSAIESYPEPFVIYDRDRRLVICNAAYRRDMARDPDSIRPGMDAWDILRNAVDEGLLVAPDGDVEAYLERLKEEDRNEVERLDLSFEDDRHYRVLRSTTANGDLVVIRVNTTELVRRSREAEDARARLVAALDAFPSPAAIYDSENRLVIFNGDYARSLSDEISDIAPGMTLADCLSVGLRNGRFPDAAGREAAWLESTLSDSDHCRPVHDTATDRDIHHRVLRSRSESGDLVILKMDVTELVRQRRAVEDYAHRLEIANRAIRHEALHDQLTGLGNRRYLHEHFDKLSSRRRREGGELAVLNIDLDRFKPINDTIGHAAGDHVLIEMACRIRSNLRDGDVVARIGGDEFVILLHLTEDIERPIRLADALLRDLSAPSVFEGKECRVGVSIGIARTPLAAEADLLVNSDVALYTAKRAGRGQVGIFERSDMVEMRRVKSLADDILRALEAGEFEPYYQPQVCATTGRVVGMEALARWRHPHMGTLPPAHFIPVATDLNVMAEIDGMIFEKAVHACRDAFADRHEAPNLSFNVSIKRLLSDDIEQIGHAAQRYPGEISVELLETIFLEEASPDLLKRIARFREMGLTIEVDDFGSGRASVLALQNIGPDRLKIDRRLISPLRETPAAQRLVQSIVQIGHALGIGITAEGVETAAHAKILADLGCDRLQGFHFAPALPLEKFLILLDREAEGKSATASLPLVRLARARPSGT